MVGQAVSPARVELWTFFSTLLEEISLDGDVMHEILDHLHPGARVLDLGAREGSFSVAPYPVRTIRVDLVSQRGKGDLLVQADASRLPFRSRTFDAVILNHSLEHFVRLKPALQEIGHVVKVQGAVYATVSDATTITARVYRKVYKDSGGHVNLFGSPAKLERMLSWYFGLPHIATRTLFSSLSFLNRYNTRDPRVRRQMSVGGVCEPALALIAAATRLLDRYLGSRTSVYGWAFYFGTVPEIVDLLPLRNVCIRRGQAHPSDTILKRNLVTRRFLVLLYYRCPDCSAWNVFTDDPR